MPKPMYVWSGTAWVSVASEVESLATYATQSYADNLPGTRIIIPTSVAVGSGSGSIGTSGTVTFSGASSVSFNGCFTSTYRNYLLIVTGTGSASSETDVFIRFRANGTDDTNTNYFRWNYNRTNAGAGNGYSGSQNTALIGSCASGGFHMVANVLQPQVTANSMINAQSHSYGSTSSNAYWSQAQFIATTSFDGITFYPGSGTISGTATIYGMKN